MQNRKFYYTKKVTRKNYLSIESRLYWLSSWASDRLVWSFWNAVLCLKFAWFYFLTNFATIFFRLFLSRKSSVEIFCIFCCILIQNLKLLLQKTINFYNSKMFPTNFSHRKWLIFLVKTIFTSPKITYLNLGLCVAAGCLYIP
jgi:hypothetical protein